MLLKLCFVVAVLQCVQSINAECPSPDSQDMVKYFDLGENPDLTKIIWTHATNSWTLLQKALEDDTQMIEADVIHHVINGNMEVVMGHSGEEIADNPLKLKDFLETIQKHQETERKPKGAKLDFKSSMSFHLAMDANLFTGVNYPLWINADITQGPQGSVEKIIDLKLHEPATTERLKCYTLSLGWTSGKWDHITDRRYTVEQIDAVLEKDFEDPDKVRTYPTRAAWVADSWEDLKRLLLTSPKNTLTIWSPEDDDEDIEYEKLKPIVQGNKGKIYVDVPEVIRSKLGLETTTIETTSTETISSFEGSGEETATSMQTTSKETVATDEQNSSSIGHLIDGSSEETSESTEGTTAEGKPSTSPQTQQPSGASGMLGMPLLVLALLTWLAALT